MATYSITGPDGKVYSIDGPTGATQEQVIAQIQAAKQSVPATTQPEAKAPLWDIPGDIGRAAIASASAIPEDLHAAFPSGQELMAGQAANRAKYGAIGGALANEVAGGKRVLSLAKVPLDAMGVVASPVIGALHGIAGSALSYIIPTLDKDTVAPDGTVYYNSDPKKAADQIIDSSLIGIGPKGMGSVGGMQAAVADAEAANAARAAAKAKNAAIDKVAKRAKQDGLTAQEVLDAQAKANANGDKITLMDLGDKNVQGLAGAVYRAPGAGGKTIGTFLDTRDAEAAGNLTGDIKSNVASGSTYQAQQDLLKSRSAAAGPAYKEAEAVGPVHSERLQTFLEQPEVQEGLRRGIKLERLNAVAENRPFVDSDYGIVGYQDGNWDMPIFSKVPTVKSLIVANEGLGAKIAELVDPRTGRLTKDGLALKKFRDAYQGEVDNLTGGKYKAARDVWSGPSQSMEAIRDGREHFTRTDSNEQIKAEFDQLSPGDKEFYRLGAAEAKVNAVESAADAADKSKRVINSIKDRKRFEMLFDTPAEAQKFMESVARKRKMFETKTAVKGNSATAGRLAEDEDHAGTILEAAKGARDVATGNWFGLADRVARMRQLGLRNNEGLNSEIANILTNPNLAVGSNGEILSRVPVPPRSNYFAKTGATNALMAAPKQRANK